MNTERWRANERTSHFPPLTAGNWRLPGWGGVLRQAGALAVKHDDVCIVIRAHYKLRIGRKDGVQYDCRKYPVSLLELGGADVSDGMKQSSPKLQQYSTRRL